MKTFEFKIIHKDTLQYQRAGTWVAWDNKGKTWRSRAALSNHLRLVIDSKFNNLRDYENWKIEVTEILRLPPTTTDFFDFYPKKA